MRDLGHATRSIEPAMCTRGPATPGSGALLRSDAADAELAELFDRYLCVFADATRRFGHLFPYNHLRLRIQSILAGRTARVLVRDAIGAALATFDIEWRDGEFRRVPMTPNPAFSWVLDVRTLEDAAAAPWVYLAHPRQLGFAWFDGTGVSQQTAAARSRARRTPTANPTDCDS